MTIRTKRRGRTLAAILAAMLMASVLSVVAGSPSQAANTSGEHLVDTNSDGKPDSRQFAGAHRYVTAQYLADSYATQTGSPASVILASGESEVDAVTAAGLAGNLDAPILLTRGDRLPHNVARYIDNHNVSHVVIVGGTAAISEAVETAVESLGGAPSTERVQGDDRYGTAAAIGSRLGGPNPTWCNSTQRAAILVNGGAEGRADAIAIGPIAFRLGLPILLTTADELPMSTADFLTDNEVEHVVIVGGTDAVSDGIREAMIEDVGVITVRRISGGDAAGTSVEIAEEMLGNCAAVMGTDMDRVALVNRDATADGVAAGPAMGEGLGDGPVPILLVGDELPTAVSDYLAATPESRRGHGKTNLSIVAVGGTAVVSADVMSAAVAAAKTSPALTATINFTEDKVAPIDNSKFTVTFSDDVVADKVTDPNLYRVNGRRLEADPATTADEATTLENQIHIERRTVTVDLVHNLKAGDVVSVVGGGKVGANNDMRPLEAASLTISLAAAAADRSAPVVEIVSVANQGSFSIFVTEPNPLTNPDGTTYRAPDGITIAKGSSTADAPTIATIAVEAATGRPGGAARYTVTLTGGETLAKGNVIQVDRNTFLDKGNRGNRLTRATVANPRADFAISSISIGNAEAVDQASVNIDNNDTPNDAEDIVVTAKRGGAADGSAGNGWRIFGYELPTKDTTKPVDIDVEVDMTHKIITYTVNNGAPTVLDLAKALSGNDNFAANFGLSYDASVAADARLHTTVVGAIDPVADMLSGGTSRVAVRVTFNDVVEGLTADAAGVDSDNTLAAAILGKVASDLDTFDAGSPTADLTVATLFAQPDRHVWFTYTSDEMDMDNALPVRGGTRVIPGGLANNYHATSGDGPIGTPADPDAEDNTDASDNSASTIVRSLRPDSTLKPF